MTTKPKCLPRCRFMAVGYPTQKFVHAPGCPNAEAPKVEYVSVAGLGPDLALKDEVIDHEQTERALRAENQRLSAADSAFVEMNAVFEAVMRAIRGEALSDFDLSHGSVYEANALRAEVEGLKERLEGIAKKADHQIPPYAYGDNEAACDMANRLQEIYEDSHDQHHM